MTEKELKIVSAAKNLALAQEHLYNYRMIADELKWPDIYAIVEKLSVLERAAWEKVKIEEK